MTAPKPPEEEPNVVNVEPEKEPLEMPEQTYPAPGDVEPSE